MNKSLVPAADGRVNLFAGFDDYMEKKEPGWKALRAAERQAKAEDRAAFRTLLIKRYGSKANALAPSPRERTVNAALNPHEITALKTFANGTFERTTLRGWQAFDQFQDAPQEIVDAASAALPLPTTIVEAEEELALWTEREREVDVLLEGKAGDYPLGDACTLRRMLVQHLLETGLRATCVADVLVRMRHYVEMEFDMPEIGRAAVADLEHLLSLEAGR